MPRTSLLKDISQLLGNLLRKDFKLQHNVANCIANVDMSTKVEGTTVLHRMEFIHPSLQALVQITFAYDLQRMMLKDLQQQISDALYRYLEE